MKNEIFYPVDPSAKVSLPVPDGTVSGAPVLVGSLVGVTATKEGEGGNADNYASVWLGGVYDLTVSTTTALTVGAPVYITSGNVLTPSSSGNTLFGYALTAKGTSPAIVRVLVARV